MNDELIERRLVELADTAESPDPQHLERINNMLRTSLEPVRPFPSDAAATFTITGIVLAFAMLVAVPFGYNGFHSLTTIQALFYYTVLTCTAVLLAAATVQQMIPGSKQRIRPATAIAAALLAIAVVVGVLFQDMTLTNFVRRGWPCLRLGTCCAIVVGLASPLLLRRGFVWSPVRLFVTAGVLAGLAGVVVLALHCPFLNAAHILVWHLGAMILGGLGGAAIGFYCEHFLQNNAIQP